MGIVFSFFLVSSSNSKFFETLLRKLFSLQLALDLSHDAIKGGIFDRGESEKYNYGVYHKLEEIDNWADKMVANEANHMKKEIIGKSWEDRDLYVLILDELTGVEGLGINYM